MKNSIFFIYLLILAGTTYLIRVIPFTAIKEKINNRFVRSFLYYIPYAVLTAMTIPAIFYATSWWVGATAGLLTAVIFAPTHQLERQRSYNCCYSVMCSSISC